MKCAIVVLLCLNYAFLLCDCRMSGLYIDNGVDQTLVQRFMTRQEKREVEHEILNLLGLQYRPRPANSKTLGSSAPKFLLDVYKSLLDSPNSRSTRSEFNLSGRDLHAIDESDVIMTFTSNSKLHSYLIYFLLFLMDWPKRDGLVCVRLSLQFLYSRQINMT